MQEFCITLIVTCDYPGCRNHLTLREAPGASKIEAREYARMKNPDWNVSNRGDGHTDDRCPEHVGLNKRFAHLPQPSPEVREKFVLMYFRDNKTLQEIANHFGAKSHTWAAEMMDRMGIERKP